jgi:acyl carrier protein
MITNLRPLIFLIVSVAALLFAIAKAAWLGLSHIPWYIRVPSFAIFIAFAGLAQRISDETERKKALSHLQNRPALNVEEFGRHFSPPDRAQIASQLREILAHHIFVDLSQLDPDDKLVEDIRMDALDSMSTVEFVLEVEKEFGSPFLTPLRKKCALCATLQITLRQSPHKNKLASELPSRKLNIISILFARIWQLLFVGQNVCR